MINIEPTAIYNIEEIAKGLNVCKGTVYNYINQDGLPFKRIRGSTYIKGSDLLKFLFGE